MPTPQANSHITRWATASLALHLVVLAAFLHHPRLLLTPISLPGTQQGHHLLLTYAPHGGSPAATMQAPTRPDKLPELIHAPAKAAQQSTPSAPTLSAGTDTTTGSDALGDGNAIIAQLVIHPPPHPDLSRLPSGTRGDVVVDIVIDTNGRITKSTMLRGLGHGIDETVLATIQGWTFQPATRNGTPVVSEQELLFHYERT